MATPALLSIPCFKTIAGLQTYLHQWEGKRIGLVPTMGALHQGHGSLIERAAQESDCVVVSIFVNPLQFGPQEDFHRYPRNLEQDSQLAQTWGASVIFAPEPGEMGVEDSSPRTLVVPPKELSDRLCGKYRPGHFTGVATIVLKLLNIVRPTVAYFGEKDAQQLGIIRRLVADLNIPVTIQGCPTVRETSGLALSSRNQYLSNEEKTQASQLYPALLAAQTQFQQGDHHAPSLLATVNKHLIQIPDLKLQYLTLVDPQTLQPLETVTQSGLLALAAYVGQTRLIDNCLLRHRSPIIAIDGPAGAGKSTVTRQVADRLGLLYLDTGAMYRAIAWLVQQSGLDPQDEPQIAELVSQAQLELIARPAPQLTGVTLNGRDISEAIRTPEITALVSAIAAQKAVREVLVRTQRCLGEKGGLVAEGRDIGTQVFPDAEVKIFLTASVEERARRRLHDFQAQGQIQFSLEALQQEIARRDEMDSNREISPLRQAEDAIFLITDGLTIEAVITQILAIVQEKTGKTTLF
jgi:pantoate ligase/cytidylate kinase